MAIDPELVKKKLDALAEWIRQIEHMDFDEYGLRENIDLQHLLSFRLQQAVETSIDIATQFWRRSDPVRKPLPTHLTRWRKNT